MPLRHARTLVVALGLLVLTNGPVFFIATHVLGSSLGWERPFVREVFIAFALAATLTVLLDGSRQSGLRLMAPSPVAAAAVVGFTGWVVLSSLWSLAPELTRGRSLIYIGLAAFAWIVADLDDREFRIALAWAAAVGVLGSLAAVVFMPSSAVDINDDWQGIYTNRNSLAPVAGVAILAGLSLAWEATGRRRLALAALVVASAVAMLGSGSRTAWLALLVAMGVAVTVAAIRLLHDRHRRRGAWAAAGAALAGTALIVGIVAVMWNETTFAQRRTIWGQVWNRIAERPIHGHGWFSIWNVPEFTSEHWLLARGSAHGSFFEVWLGVGLIGVIPFLVIVGLALHATARAVWRNPGVSSITWLAVVVFLVIENLTESFVLWFSYNWVMLMAAALRSDVGRRRQAVPQTLAASEPVSV